MKFNDKFKFSERLTPEEFIRRYALRIYNIHCLQFGLLMACGESPSKAATLLAITETRCLPYRNTLLRLGYLKDV